MSAAALLALAAQVVMLRPKDIETKAVYVRVGVGVESRLTLPEPAVRVRGQQSSKELLGLRLGQVRPKGVLLIRPREAATAAVVFEGATHRIRLDIEASVLGTAQDVEFRLGEPVVAATPTPGPSKAAAAAPPKAAAIPASQPTPPRKTEARPAQTQTAQAVEPVDRKAAAKEAHHAPTQVQLVAGAPSPGPSPSPAPTSTPSPAPTPPPVVAQASVETSTPASGLPSPSAMPVESKRQVARIGRHVGMPGQRGVWIDELVREGTRVSLRVRVEGGAGAVEVKSLDIEGVPATVRSEVAGRDLVVVGEVPLPAQKPRQATLAMAEGGRFRKEKLKLVGPGLADLVFDGGRAW